MPRSKDRYTQIIEWIFNKYYQEGKNEFSFERADIIDAAKELDIILPKNLGKRSVGRSKSLIQDVGVRIVRL